MECSGRSLESGRVERITPKKGDSRTTAPVLHEEKDILNCDFEGTNKSKANCLSRMAAAFHAQPEARWYLSRDLEQVAVERMKAKDTLAS